MAGQVGALDVGYRPGFSFDDLKGTKLLYLLGAVRYSLQPVRLCTVGNIAPGRGRGADICIKMSFETTPKCYNSTAHKILHQGVVERLIYIYMYI